MTEGSAHGLLEMPCLGRPFQLGTLYDCRNDRSIPGVTLWDPDTLGNVISKPMETSEFEIITEDSFNQKTLHLDVSAGLKLSVLGGLVKAGGSGKFLYDRTTSKNQARVSLRYKSTSRFEELNMSQLGKVKYPQVFEDDIATHVVTRVQYGADAVFVFDRQVDSTENFYQVHGSLEAKISVLPSIDLQVGGSADLDLQKRRNEGKEIIQCKFYGDFVLLKNPTTYEDAVKVYQELPMHLGGAGCPKSVPKKVWLHPLSKLGNRVQRMVREIKSNLIDDLQEVMESLHKQEVRINDLIKSEVCYYFEDIKADLEKLRRLIGAYKVTVMNMLSTLLPKVRGGGEEEAKLAELLEMNCKSPFSYEKVSSWIKEKEKEVDILTVYLTELKKHDIQFAFKSDKMVTLTSGLSADSVLCFDFNIPAGKDSHLQRMENYLHGRRVEQELQLKYSWYESRELRQQLQRFVGFVTRNCSKDSVCKYVVTNGYDSDSSKLGVMLVFIEGVYYVLKALNIGYESFQLNWNKPNYDGILYYSISYRSEDDPSNKWSTLITKNCDNKHTFIAAPKKKYFFKISSVTNAGCSSDSEVSGPFMTRPKPFGSRLLSSCMLISENNPRMYQLPLHYTMKRNGIIKATVGSNPPEHKVLMVVGATGAGKSTLINAMANYIMGVDWEDEYRFKLISEETAHDQTKSQTKCITAYTFHKQEGSPLPYTLTVIDTPGFGELERDKEIIQQIKEFFSMRGDKGIDQLHGIGFVTQATQTRLTPKQRYVFDSILSVFGKDVADNIFLMATFDGERPPVLDAARAAGVPFKCHFKFNNSALFASNQSKTFDEFDAMFWEMGKKSFEDYFSHFSKVQSRSLRQSREVLLERKKMELTIQILQPQIRARLAKIDKLRQERRILNGYEADIIASRNFTVQVEILKRRRIDLPPPAGQYTYSCLKCNIMHLS